MDVAVNGAGVGVAGARGYLASAVFATMFDGCDNLSHTGHATATAGLGACSPGTVGVFAVTRAPVFVAVLEGDVTGTSSTTEGGKSVATSAGLSAAAAGLGTGLPCSPASHDAVRRAGML